MPTPIKHAILAPSAADRWIHCPGSVALTKNLPDKDTVYTREGTLAHAIAELKLQKRFGICPDGHKRPLGPRKYKAELSKLQANELYNPEMDGYTDIYIDHITDVANSFDRRPAIFAEVSLNLSNIAPESFGQADCIMLYGNDLYVFDFKYGKDVPVVAAGNPQLRLYGLGALRAFQQFWVINTVHTTIVQPRLDSITGDAIPAADLIAWGENIVKPAAEKAFNGCGEYHPGDWCRWCRAGATCRKYATDVTQAVKDFKRLLPPKLSAKEFGDLLHKLEPLLEYARKAKQYALDSLMQGKKIPGWKLVEGRSKRIWDNQDAAFNDLKAAGIKPEMLYHREPYTLSQLEKQIGKKQFTEIAGKHVIKQPGSPTPVPETDKRPAYSPQATADDDFKDLITK